MNFQYTPQIESEIMNSNQNLVEISYRKSLKLLSIQGWFFRVDDLDARCIEVINDHFKDETKLTIIMKVELIDAVSSSALEKLIYYLNKLSIKYDIELKWLSSPESMIAGQRLKRLVEFPFHTFLE